MAWFGWKLTGLLGSAFLLVAITSAAAQSPEVASGPLHLADYLGFSGVIAIVGWAVQWGRHAEFKKSTTEKLTAFEGAFLRTERWEDHRAREDQRHNEVLERIENIHRSIQTIRRDQLERIHGLTDRDGGV